MKLTVSIAQCQILQGEPEANLERAQALLAEAARRGSQLVCLPEMWTTGLNWRRNQDLLAGQRAIVERIQKLASRHGVWLNGSVLVPAEGGRPTNTSLLISADGQIAAAYRKVHLFSIGRENEFMIAGNSLTTPDSPWGRIGLSICYDLRFPELFRAYALRDVQIQLCPAAWPAVRIEHWRTLLRARAIEDQMFVIGTNQVGAEDTGQFGPITYGGRSAIIDPWGQTIVEAGPDESALLTATIEVDEVRRTRQKMRVLQDRRPEVYGS